MEATTRQRELDLITQRDEARAQLKALREDMSELQAAIRRTTEDVMNALAVVSRDLDFHKTELGRANKVIALASAAINYMFDKRSDADIVTDDDMAATDEAFEAVQQWLEEHK